MANFLVKLVIIFCISISPTFGLAQDDQELGAQELPSGIFKSSDLPNPKIKPNDQDFPNYKVDQKQRIARALDFYVRFINTYSESLPPQIREASRQGIKNYITGISQQLESNEVLQRPMSATLLKIYLDNIVRNSQRLPAPMVKADPEPELKEFKDFGEFRKAYWAWMKDYYNRWCDIWKADRGVSFCLPAYTIAMRDLFVRMPTITTVEEIKKMPEVVFASSKQGYRRFENSGPLGIVRYLSSSIESVLENEGRSKDAFVDEELIARLEGLRSRWVAISSIIETNQKNASQSRLSLLKTAVKTVSVRAIIATVFLFAAVIFLGLGTRVPTARARVLLPFFLLSGLIVAGWNSGSTEEDSFPNPKVQVEDRNYPNLAFSIEEARRRKVDAISDYLLKFEDQQKQGNLAQVTEIMGARVALRAPPGLGDR